MRFAYHRLEQLPRLAWCARLVRGSSEVVVRHGPWLETRPDRFFEGLWDGDFAAGRFEESCSFSGSGAIAGPAAVTFVGSISIPQWLYVVRDGDRVTVSNSMAFLLAETDDAPELSYPYYYDDIIGIVRNGLSRPERAFVPTRRERRLFLYGGVRLRMQSDLSITLEPRPRPASPTSYSSYVRLLQETLERSLDNAGAAGRQQRYRPLVTLSCGYDSPAIAVLAARAGVREAATFSNVRGTGDIDNGRRIGERLGFEVTEYEHLAHLRLPGTPEAEACLSDWGSTTPFAAMEPQLTGSVVLSGNGGDVVWRTDRAKSMGRVPWAGSTGGASMLELRLRAGILQLNLAHMHSLDGPSVRRLSTSDEMRPWSLGGDYNRPIPRRLLEQAGIPRDWFARGKRHAAFLPFQRFDPARASHQELRRFVDAIPRDRAREWKERILQRVYRADSSVSRVAERAVRALGADVRLYPSVHIRWRWSPPLGAWGFHWGFEKIRGRYVVR